VNEVKCPYCGSSRLHAYKKGYNDTAVFLGVVTFGLLGSLAGFLGSENIEILCVSCGRKSIPGQQPSRGFDFYIPEWLLPWVVYGGSAAMVVYTIYAIFFEK